MSGYIRQSQAEILDGEPVVAGPLNREFNALADTFDGALGHTHDGSTGQGKPINLETSVSGILLQANGGGAKNNYTAVLDPTASDDENADYAVGSRWVNTLTGDLFELKDATASTAVWVKAATYNYVDSLISTNEQILEDTEDARDAAISARNAAQSALSSTNTARDEAIDAKNDAEDAADLATSKAGEAATSASNASTSAGTASTGASTATTKATEAGTSATLAQKWATEDEDVEVVTGEYSAYHWAAKAEASAIAAATFDPDSYYTSTEMDTILGGYTTDLELSNALSSYTTTSGLGSAAFASTTAFATASQGSKADSALQAASIGVSVQAYDSNTAKLNTDQSWSGAQRFGTLTTLTSAATVTISFADGNDYYIIAGHNITLANPSDIGSFVGQKGSIVGEQDATGGRTISYGTYWYPIGASTAPAIPTGANNKFRIDYHVVSSTRIDFSVSKVGV